MKKRLFVAAVILCIGLVLLASPFLSSCASSKPTTAPAPSPTTRVPTPTPTSTATPPPSPKSTQAAEKPVGIVHMSPYDRSSRTNYIMWDVFMNKVEQRSNGRVTFKRFYGAELVSLNNVLEAVAKGTIDMASAPGSSWESIVPEGDYDLTFFNYPSQASAGLFFQLPEVNKIYQDAYAKAGVLNLGQYAQDDQTLMTRIPITKLADLKGLKMRGGGGMANKGLEALGTTPVFIAAPELYTALQRGTVDGCIVSTYNHYVMKLYEVTKYVSLPPVVPVIGQQWFINPNKWKELTPDLQKLFKDTFNEQATWFVVQTSRENESIRSLDEAKGTIYSAVPPEEFAKMKAAAEPLKEAWAKRSPGAARLLELVRAWEKLDYKKWQF